MDLDKLLDRDDLYITQVDDWSFIWRLLTIREYRKFDLLRSTGLFHPYYLQVKAFQRVYQGDFGLLNQRMPMGIPISLGGVVLYVSGDCEVDVDLVKTDLGFIRETYRARAILEVFKRVILMGFPTYGPRDLDEMNRHELMKLFVEAEEMLLYRTNGQYVPFDLSKIVTADSMAAPEELPVVPGRINTQEENEKIRQNLSPWDEYDQAEREYEQKKNQLTAAQAKKLDNLRR